MKIVVLDGFTENPGDLSWDSLRALGELTVYDRTPKEAVCDRCRDAEILVTNKVPVTRELLERCPGIRYVAVTATGYNVVDLQETARRGIPVSNVPAYGTAAVAQFTVAMLLEICCRMLSIRPSNARLPASCRKHRCRRIFGGRSCSFFHEA